MIYFQKKGRYNTLVEWQRVRVVKAIVSIGVDLFKLIPAGSINEIKGLRYLIMDSESNALLLLNWSQLYSYIWLDGEQFKVSIEGMTEVEYLYSLW